MKCRVTASVNAGVALQLGQVRVWCDVLHNTIVPGFSTLSDKQWQELQRNGDFAAPDLLFYTHCHPDHYARELTARIQERNPHAFLALPQKDFSDQILLQGEQHRMRMGDLTFTFCRLPHEGIQYSDVSHYGCLLEWNGFSVLLPGDCAVANGALERLVQGKRVDLAILNFPWVTLKKGREFVEKVIKPKHLIINHLPLQEDDVYAVIEPIKKSIGLLPYYIDVRLMEKAFQVEEF